MVGEMERERERVVELFRFGAFSLLTCHPS